MKRTFENILTPIGAFLGCLGGAIFGSRTVVKYENKPINGKVIFQLLGWLIGYLLFNRIGCEIDRKNALSDPYCGFDEDGDYEFDYDCCE